MHTPLSKISPLKRKTTIAITLLQTKKITELGKKGEIKEAINVFTQMPRKNQVTYNAMLSALLDSNHFDFALNLFDMMPKKNPRSYTSIITGLSLSGLVSRARQIFDSIRILNHNVFSWTAMLSCYVQNGMSTKALNLFRHHYGSFYELDVFPNSHTFSVLLKACNSIQSVHAACQIHGLLCKLLDEESEDTIFVWNALIDVYAKLGKLGDAEKIFSRMKCKDLATLDTMMDAYTFHLLIDRALEIFHSMERKDVLSWNIVISGLLECRRGEEALMLFTHLMKSDDLKPNASTCTVLSSLCASLSIIEFGKQVHTSIVKYGFYGCNTHVSNSLITMYASFGMTEESEQVFNEMCGKDAISWNSVIQGLGQNGCANRALDIAEMALSSNNYNHNTFIATLTSCSHGGFLTKGLEYLNSMKEKYGLEPNSDHYICVIDLLGRSGKLQEAHAYLHQKGLILNSIAWATLLNACYIHGNGEIGEIAAEKFTELEPNNTRSYLSLAKVYFSNNKIEESKTLLDLLRKRDLKKNPGYSWVTEK